LHELRQLLEQARAKLAEICPDVWQRKVALDHLDGAELWAEQGARQQLQLKGGSLWPRLAG
jgi:hypothetical protein